ncbi:MAG: GNAT family N-acetyltransferase [Chloroflexi bacterium HGW-Chloroflexi-3]|nr:MAG: GNAT family N-acetyltransferase [Chloroflexi bacterium HGW-Chloroflexi-3]
MIRVEQVKVVNTEIVQAIQHLFPQLTQFSPMPDENVIQKMVNSQSSSLWIARNVGGEIIGMLSLAIYQTTTGIHAWIEDVVVDQKARRQGVAWNLTQAAIEFSQENDAKAVSLTSRPVREAANQLYQKLGFEQVETNLYRLKLD